MTFETNGEQANRRALAAAVARVRARVESGGAGAAEVNETGLDGSALSRLCHVFGLTRFERDVLLLCAGPELDGGFPGVPSFGLALATLAEPHWSALPPHAPLRWWRLIRLANDAPLCEARLRIEEAVLHVLTGLPCPDERLAGLIAALPAPSALPASQAVCADRVAACLSRGGMPMLAGPASETEAVAACVAERLGMSIGAADEATFASAAAPEAWLKLWQRDAMIAPAILMVRHEGDPAPQSRTPIAAALRDMRTPVLLAGPTACDLPGLTTTRFAIARPTRDEQASLWRAALRPAEDDVAAQAAIGRVVTHFDLGGAAIEAAARAADSAPARIWAACRNLAAQTCEQASARQATARWSDLALPAAQEAVLHAIAAQARHRHQVHDHWGFGGRGVRGQGVTALFYGPSGTGKSLAAEVIAAELDLDLQVVDLSRVVSKYIGDTERHLRAAFEAAEASGAVLLFDEADALFGARSEVRDSHDRYANIEVSYLLQRLEQYRGLAILTTNMKDSIDTAFLRRIRFLVEFTHPGQAERARLWQLAFPAQAPRESVDPAALARANFTGAQIHAVALAAAFLAAEEGTPIRMTHLLQAAQRECAKLQRPLTQSEVAGWV